MMYTTTLHGAGFTDYMPVGEIKCLMIDGEDVAHYRLHEQGSQVVVTQVERTDEGTGDNWYEIWGPWFMPSPEAAEQLISDKHRGVTRIGRGNGVTERYLGGERLDDAIGG